VADDTAPDPGLVAMADDVMRRAIDGERIPRMQFDAAALVLRRAPVGKDPNPATGAGA